MKNSVQINLGRQIKKLRTRAGYSQEVFAEKIDIAINTLSNIERGNAFMTAKTMDRIITVLNIKPCELFEFDEYKDNEDTYKYIISQVKLLKNNKTKLETIKNFLKFVL